MRRLDHSMIFIFIAASFTPVAMLALEGTLATVILAVVWGGAAAGVILKLVWISAPKWLSALLYVALGWVAVAASPALWHELGWLSVVAFGVGGLLYTAGAVIYAFERPEPVAAHLRLPRGLPHARRRRGRDALRGDRVRGATAGLSRRGRGRPAG